MATYSTNLGLTLLATGEGAGTWGNTTNTNLGTLLEQAVSGYQTQALTAGTTLTLTIPNGTTGVARNMYLEFTGTGSTVIVPSNKKLYFVYNNCSSGTLTFKVAGQTGVTVENGVKKLLVSDGTDIEEAITLSTLDGVTTASNSTYGVSAGDVITTGFGNTLIGSEAGKDMTSGVGNTCVGDYAGENITSGQTNACIGRATGGGITTQNNCTYVGHGAGSSRSGADNTGLGFQALGSFGTGYSNSAVGYNALNGLGSGYQNVAVGNGAGQTVSTGYQNVFVGGGAGQGVSTNYQNTAVGTTAYNSSSNYINSACFGYNAEVTGNNQVQLGNSSTTTYAYGAVQDRSDARDKTDIRDTQLGLDFILALRPRDFKWDMREDYRPPAPAPDATQEEMDAWREACKLSNLTHDGTHTRNRYHQGLIAQEVKQTMDAMGVDFGGYQDHTIKGGDAVLTVGYEELVAPLIKAIQELKAEFDEYKRTHP